MKRCHLRSEIASSSSLLPSSNSKVIEFRQKLVRTSIKVSVLVYPRRPSCPSDLQVSAIGFKFASSQPRRPSFRNPNQNYPHELLAFKMSSSSNQTNQPMDPVLALPSEMSSQLLSFLPTRSIATSSSVCRDWRDSILSNLVLHREKD